MGRLVVEKTNLVDMPLEEPPELGQIFRFIKITELCGFPGA